MATATALTLLILFLLVIVLPPCSNFAFAQSNSSGSGISSFNPLMAILVIILLTAFFFLSVLSIYVRYCGSNYDSCILFRTTNRDALGSAFRSHSVAIRGAIGSVTSRAANRGLDPTVVAMFPTLVYSDVKEHRLGKASLECAVCLSEFDDDEKLKLLPNCCHAFHPDCIDGWFASHTTCPVCRNNLAVAEASTEASEPTIGTTDGAMASVDEELVPSTLVAGERSVVSRRPQDQEGLPDHVVVSIPTPVDESMTAPLSPYPSASRSTKRGRSVRGGSVGIARGGCVRGGSGGAGAGSLLRFWRSWSARPTVWAEEDRERFTLLLPEYIRREVISMKVNQSRSLTSFPVGALPAAVAATDVGAMEGGLLSGHRKGAGGERCGHRGRWRSATFSWATKSDKWVSLARQLSTGFGQRDSGNDGGKAADGSIVPREADGREATMYNRAKSRSKEGKKSVGVGMTGASAVDWGSGEESVPFALGFASTH